MVSIHKNELKSILEDFQDYTKVFTDIFKTEAESDASRKVFKFLREEERLGTFFQAKFSGSQLI